MIFYAILAAAQPVITETIAELHDGSSRGKAIRVLNGVFALADAVPGPNQGRRLSGGSREDWRPPRGMSSAARVSTVAAPESR
ncbi:hypothetical protein [Peterkaempfera sp. SMS 1(5)a]|uniref:hypothetical protein n=1 Tax=Peterkaempfera podocarpi TaxID=3232308 RepID=UPI00366E350E